MTSMISGVAIIRNGTKLGYPYIESIKSVLPLCDEFVVAVGDSEDDTRRRILDINDPKIRIVDTVWNMASRSGGLVLSEQTNIAMRHCRGKWLFYIQSDEVVHERDYEAIRAAVAAADRMPDIEGIAFRYVHFYGSYFTAQTGRNWYAEEVRIVRNGCGIRSHGDAQGFRRNGRKVRAGLTGARIYHYGWARPPEVMMEKVRSFHRLWHDDEWIDRNCASNDAADYFSDLGNLVDYDGDHPVTMKLRVNRDTVEFIRACRREYLAARKLPAALRDMSRRVPLFRKRNFIPVRRLK